MNQYSYTSNSDISYIDNLYSQYKSDPLSVDVTWQKFFEGFEVADENSLDSIKFTESSEEPLSITIMSASSLLLDKTLGRNFSNHFLPLKLSMTTAVLCIKGC